MEVSRFINDRPVGAVPPMKIANEGVLRIIREVQMGPPDVRPRSDGGPQEQEASSIAGSSFPSFHQLPASDI